MIFKNVSQLALKRQNIAAYKKYMLGVQDLCILRKLGKGSFATVYLARLVDTKQMYAVKVLSKHVVTTAHLYHQVMMERTALVMASRYSPQHCKKFEHCFLVCLFVHFLIINVTLAQIPQVLRDAAVRVSK